MLSIVFFFISLICIWAIVRPLLAFPTDRGLGEIQVSEHVDLERFLKGLEFEFERGLISEAEYKKQIAKTYKRLELIENAGN